MPGSVSDTASLRCEGCGKQGLAELVITTGAGTTWVMPPVGWWFRFAPLNDSRHLLTRIFEDETDPKLNLCMFNRASLAAFARCAECASELGR